MLELHYDLPGEVGITDNSGLAMYVTPSLRPIDAGTTETLLWHELSS